jgi:hypothetical protein
MMLTAKDEDGKPLKAWPKKLDDGTVATMPIDSEAVRAELGGLETKSAATDARLHSFYSGTDQESAVQQVQQPKPETGIPAAAVQKYMARWKVDEQTARARLSEVVGRQ